MSSSHTGPAGRLRGGHVDDDPRKPSAAPWAFAPTGFARMMHTEGESAVGRVAALMGVPYALSTMGTTSIEQLAAAAPDARRWFQLYLWRDREASRDFVVRAQAAGYGRHRTSRACRHAARRAN